MNYYYFKILMLHLELTSDTISSYISLSTHTHTTFSPSLLPSLYKSIFRIALHEQEVLDKIEKLLKSHRSTGFGDLFK